ncbi:MAG: nicotinamide-nucleotide amidohydrolase family protein, partial [Planctomycetes bacterium]|nr:nicotinamide-nucleotide amidohydrolase family protein [Planctomycetota bacterium]
MAKRSAEIVITGAEILRGYTLDTNAQWIAGRLRGLGIALRGIRTVGDEEEEIRRAIEAAVRADVVIVSGGLGPTADDRTRTAIGGAFGLDLRIDAAARRGIEAFYRRRGRPMPEGADVQALLPAGAVAIGNPVGVAPGFRLSRGAAMIVVLPGVPDELRAMFLAGVEPLLGGGLEEPEEIFRFYGVPEAEIDGIARRILVPPDMESLSICAQDGVITLRVPRDVSARTPGLAAALAEGSAGRALFARDERSLAEVVVGLLAARDATIATAESCTGGGLAWAITSVPGASKVFERGWIAYANAAKTDLLGIAPELMARHGAVSEPVARALAEAAAHRAGATIGVGVTGIA